MHALSYRFLSLHSFVVVVIVAAVLIFSGLIVFLCFFAFFYQLSRLDSTDRVSSVS